MGFIPAVRGIATAPRERVEGAVRFIFDALADVPVSSTILAKGMSGGGLLRRAAGDPTLNGLAVALTEMIYRYGYVSAGAGMPWPLDARPPLWDDPDRPYPRAAWTHEFVRDSRERYLARDPLKDAVTADGTPAPTRTVLSPDGGRPLDLARDLPIPLVEARRLEPLPVEVVTLFCTDLGREQWARYGGDDRLFDAERERDYLRWLTGTKPEELPVHPPSRNQTEPGGNRTATDITIPLPKSSVGEVFGVGGKQIGQYLRDGDPRFVREGHRTVRIKLPAVQEPERGEIVALQARERAAVAKRTAVRKKNRR